MTVQCIRCEYFSLRTAGQMARQGYGNCTFAQRKYEFHSATFERHCLRFSVAKEVVVEQRREWLEQQRRQFIEEVLHDKT